MIADGNMDSQLQQITHAHSQTEEITVIVPVENTQTKSYAKDRKWTLHSGIPDQRRTIANGRKLMTFVEYFSDPRSQENCPVKYAIYKAKFPYTSDQWMEGTYLLFADLDDAIHLFRRDAFKTFALTYTIYGKQKLTRRISPSPNKAKDTEIQALKQWRAKLRLATQQKQQEEHSPQVAQATRIA